MPRADKIEEGGEKRTKARKRWMKASLSAAGIGQISNKARTCLPYPLTIYRCSMNYLRISI